MDGDGKLLSLRAQDQQFCWCGLRLFRNICEPLPGCVRCVVVNLQWLGRRNCF